VSFALDCFLAGYLLLASLTIWCGQTRSSLIGIKGAQVVDGPGPAHAGLAVLRVVEPALASLPHALGSLACLIAGLAFLVGTPFDIRYAAIGALAVALYLLVVNLAFLIEDWQRGVALQRMLCVRSLLPSCFAAPMLVAGLRLMGG
jgi:hypothetical protein